MAEIHFFIQDSLTIAVLIGIIIGWVQRGRNHKQLTHQLNGNTEKLILQAKEIATQAAADAAIAAVPIVAARVIGSHLTAIRTEKEGK